MPEQLLEYMKKTGCFIIIAQMIVHLCASKEMEKHVKTQAGLMILLMVAIPVVAFFGRHPERDIIRQLEEFERKLNENVEQMEQSGNYASFQPVTSSNVLTAESELARMLEPKAAELGYRITEVRIDTTGSKVQGSEGAVLFATVEKKKSGRIDRLLTKDSISAEDCSMLREELTKVLEIKPEYLEVVPSD